MLKNVIFQSATQRGTHLMAHPPYKIECYIVLFNDLGRYRLPVLRERHPELGLLARAAGNNQLDGAALRKAGKEGVVVVFAK